MPTLDYTIGPQTADARHRVSLRLDRYFEGRTFASLKLIKIDVEGSEVAALRGAEQLLRRHRVPFVVAEVNRFALEADDHVDVSFVFNLLFRHPEGPAIG